MENAPQVTQKVPKILLEVLVYGTEKNKEKVKELNQNLQKQIDKHRKSRSRVRVFWSMNDKKSLEETKQWLIDNANCKYYVFANKDNDYSISSDFVSASLLKIKKLEDSIKAMNDSEIKLLPKKVVAEDKFDEFEPMD
jgi:hypothetical protein